MRNFTSAATGLAVAIALFRGLTRRSAQTIGNYWVDLTRGILYLLLPISIVGALILVWQGVPQTWNPTQVVTTLQGATQNIAIGPIASQEWIKELGNNGGGFLNANSAHPFENPTALTNWLEMFAILLFPFALTYTFGRYAGNQRQGWTIFAAMAVILSSARSARCTSSSSATRCSPRPSTSPPSATWRARRSGSGRRSAACSWPSRPARARARSTCGTTVPSRSPASCRCSTSSSARSRPGGIGAGMYGMLIIGAILAVFIAGLMVGRTPEYLGKKVEAFEIKMAMLVALVLGASILGFTALASVTPEGQAGPLNPGPHGFSEILYAFSSQTGNNGSAFAGLTGNTPFYNVTGALAMLIGRYGMIVPILAAGRLHGRETARRAVARDLPDHGRPVDRAADRRRDHRRRADVLPGALAGPDRRAADPERRKGLLTMSLPHSLLSVDLGRGTRRFQRFVTLGGAKPLGASRRGRAASSIRSCSARRSRTPSASWTRAC